MKHIYPSAKILTPSSLILYHLMMD